MYLFTGKLIEFSEVFRHSHFSNVNKSFFICGIALLAESVSILSKCTVEEHLPDKLSKLQCTLGEVRIYASVQLFNSLK